MVSSLFATVASLTSVPVSRKPSLSPFHGNEARSFAIPCSEFLSYQPATERLTTRFRSGRSISKIASASKADAVHSSRIVLASEFSSWLNEIGFPRQKVEIGDAGDLGLGCFAREAIRAGENVISIPESYTVSSFDVSSHAVIGPVSKGRSDLIGLTIWMLYEKSLGSDSPWFQYLRMFPESTLSPLLWEELEIDTLLFGSDLRSEIKERISALESEHGSLKANFFDKSPETFPEAHFSLAKFKSAFSVILSRVTYLPSVDVLALVPFADMVNCDAASNSVFDFDSASNSIVLKSSKDFRPGEQIFCSYGLNRANADLLTNYGFVPRSNPSDYIELKVGLVQADKLYGYKKNIVEEAGFTASQSFPLYVDRLPTQLLTYVRLARIQDPALFMKVAFERDSAIDETNEYETLMLLMGDCRERLVAYKISEEDDMGLLKRKGVSAKETAALLLLMNEKKILSATMGSLRNRLAPIRGIPTKSGMQDPNSDIKEIFDFMEEGLSAPKKLLSNIFGKPRI